MVLSSKQISSQGLLEPLKSFVCSMLPWLWKSARPSVLSCLLSYSALSCSSLSFLFYSALYRALYSTLSSLSTHGLKPVHLMTVHFLFLLFGSPDAIRLETPASTSAPLHNVSQGGGSLSFHELRQLFLNSLVFQLLLWNDSSANSAVQSNFKILYAAA